MKQVPISFRTIGDFLKSGHRFTANCIRQAPSCGHSGRVDLGDLAKRFGEKLDFYAERSRFVRLFRCSKCGTRGASFTLHNPPDEWVNPVRTWGDGSSDGRRL